MSKGFLLTFLLLILAGCQSYSSTFNCPDASGLYCMPVSLIDQRIDSGEIEEVELGQCRGKRCKKSSQQIKPELKIKKVYEAEIITESEERGEEAIIKDERLYVK